MNNSKIYIAAILILTIVAGSLMLNIENKITGNVVLENSNSQAQKIVISMKNYNYYPNTINVKSGIPVSISLDKSVYGCFRDFTIKEFGIRKYLRTIDDNIIFTPTKPGTYRFACSMGMGSGKLIVE